MKTVNTLLSLPNIGKTTASQLNQIGINSAEEFLERDPYEIFHDLLVKVDSTLCRSCLAGIVGANKGVPWHKVAKESAKEFDKRYPEHKF